MECKCIYVVMIRVSIRISCVCVCVYIYIYIVCRIVYSPGPSRDEAVARSRVGNAVDAEAHRAVVVPLDRPHAQVASLEVALHVCKSPGAVKS